MLLCGIFQYNCNNYVICNHLYIFSARKGSSILDNKVNLVLVCKKNSEEFAENIFSFRMSSKIHQKSLEKEIFHKNFG